MTPTAINPKVVILLNKNAPNLVEAFATNVDPELKVEVVTTVTDFNNASAGVTFNSTRPLPPPQVLSSAASKARYAKP